MGEGSEGQELATWWASCLGVRGREVWILVGFFGKGEVFFFFVERVWVRSTILGERVALQGVLWMRVRDFARGASWC